MYVLAAAAAWFPDGRSTSRIDRIGEQSSDSNDATLYVASSAAADARSLWCLYVAYVGTREHYCVAALFTHALINICMRSSRRDRKTIVSYASHTGTIIIEGC